MTANLGDKNKLLGAHYGARPQDRDKLRNFYVHHLGMQEVLGMPPTPDHQTTPLCGLSFGERGNDAVVDSAGGHDSLNVHFPFSPDSAGLSYEFDESVSTTNPSSKESVYWKIGIAVDDVVAAAPAVGDATAKSAHSFPADSKDVGFMMHINDPCGAMAM